MRIRKPLLNIVILAGLSASLLLSACAGLGRPAATPTPSPTPLAHTAFVRPGVDGVIFSETVSDVAAINMVLPDQKLEGYWTPNKDDVSKLEQGLAAFLQAQTGSKHPEIVQKLADYRRQYFGVKTGGKKLIYTIMFCRENAPGEEWKTQPVWVQEAGSCFVQVEFEPQSGTYSRLLVQGD